jgi:hypothetical protein
MRGDHPFLRRRSIAVTVTKPTPTSAHVPYASCACPLIEARDPVRLSSE